MFVVVEKVAAGSLGRPRSQSGPRPHDEYLVTTKMSESLRRVSGMDESGGPRLDGAVASERVDPPLRDVYPPTRLELDMMGAAELLDFAEALPVDGMLVDVLLSLGSPSHYDAAIQVRLAQQWARVEAAASGHKLAAVGEFDAAGTAPDDLLDFRDLEIATALNVGTNTARNLMALGNTLVTKGPRVLASMREGSIGYCHALQYFDAFAGLAPEKCARVEELTVDKARTRTPSELRKLLRRTMARVDAEDFAKRHRADKKKTRLSVSYEKNPGGMATLFGWLPAVDATIIESAVEAWARAAKAAGDERTLDELRVAGLVDLAERYLMGPNAPRAHGRPITVNVTMDLLTFLGLTDHPGEVLGTGAMIPASALRDLIPDATLRRLVTDPLTGHLLDYSRSTYRFPPDAAAFVIAKWVTSTGPGSTVPAERCDIDHGKPWDDRGPTNPDNGNPCNGAGIARKPSGVGPFGNATTAGSGPARSDCTTRPRPTTTGWARSSTFRTPLFPVRSRGRRSHQSPGRTAGRRTPVSRASEHRARAAGVRARRPRRRRPNRAPAR